MFKIGFGAVLGFLLSIGGALILQRIERRQSKKDFQQNLCAELRELIPRLADTHHLLNTELGTIDREKKEWYKSCMKVLEPKVWWVISKQLLQMDDKAIEEMNAHQKCKRAEEGYQEVVLLRKYIVPLIESPTSPIFLVNSSLQQDIILLRTKIQWLNEHIDDYIVFYWKTFEPDLKTDTHKVLIENMSRYYHDIAAHSRAAADLALKIMAGTHTR